MASINVIARERKEAFREAKRYLKFVDTIQEAMKRYIDRVIARKKKLPETQDVMDLVGMVELLTVATDNIGDLLGEMSDFFADGLSAKEAGGLKDWLQEKGWMGTDSNVVSFNPQEAGAYMKIVFGSDKAAQDFIDANPQYQDVVVGRKRN